MKHQAASIYVQWWERELPCLLCKMIQYYPWIISDRPSQGCSSSFLTVKTPHSRAPVIMLKCLTSMSRLFQCVSLFSTHIVFSIVKIVHIQNIPRAGSWRMEQRCIFPWTIIGKQNCSAVPFASLLNHAIGRRSCIGNRVCLPQFKIQFLAISPLPRYP